MRFLSMKKTMRLWDRLEHEARSYYETLHEARWDVQNIGPCDESERRFSDLLRWQRRLKQRFIVMAIIGRPHVLPYRAIGASNISDLVLNCADQVIGWGAIQETLQKESDNVRVW